MKVLFLGYLDSPLINFLEAQGEIVTATDQRVDAMSVRGFTAEFLVSYGYRHLIKKEVLDLFSKRAVNLHISLLPWNRGADPNLWSFVSGTPKGVTIHYLEEGLDTGDIAAQREMHFDPSKETLQSTYLKLHHEIQQLFKDVWPALKSGSAPRVPQPSGGSYHSIKDRHAIVSRLTKGWDTPVTELAMSIPSTPETLK